MSSGVVQFGYGMPLRPATEQGSLRIEFVFRSDDNRFLTFHGDVDRWPTSAVLSGRPDAAEQLLDQIGTIFRSFCKKVHKHFGLGALEQDG